MTWAMHMKMPEEIEQKREVTIDDPKCGHVVLKLIGPSMWGEIYQCLSTSSVYRLIPMRDIPTPEQRGETSKLKDNPRQSQIAPVTNTFRASVGGIEHFCVHYDVFPNYYWQDVIDNDPTMDCLAVCFKVLSSLPYWWGKGMQKFFPMPADVIFVSETPFILQLPVRFLPNPGIDSLFDIPIRVLYLPPELLAGQVSKIGGRSVDMFALGITLLRCLYHLEPFADAETHLRRAATGVLPSDTFVHSRLPYWSRLVPQLVQKLDTVKTLVDVDVTQRVSLSPTELVSFLKDSSSFLAPEVAAQQMIDTNQFELAHSFLQEVEVDEELPNILLMHARLMESQLKRPVEAIDLYERAIKLQVNNLDAYTEQLTLLGEYCSTVLEQRSNSNSAISLESAKSWIAQTARRNFSVIPVSLRPEYVEAAGRIYLGLGLFTETVQLVYGYIVQGDKFHWWEFSLCFIYTEALLFEGKFPLLEVSNFLSNIEINLAKVQSENRLSSEELELYREKAARLRELIKTEGLHKTATPLEQKCTESGMP